LAKTQVFKVIRRIQKIDNQVQRRAMNWAISVSLICYMKGANSRPLDQ
jgi:hypothetical protein